MLERQVYQEKILGLIYQTLIFFNTTIIISNFCLKQRQLIDILNRLVEIKNLTFELDRVDKSRWRSLYKDVAMVFGFVVFCLTISLVLQSFCTDEDIGKNCVPLIVLGYIFNDFMILFVYVQYSLLLMVVLHAARLMNDNLSALPRYLTLRQGGSDSELVAIIAKIERCRELYSRFVDLVDVFSDFFSFPMLSVICFFLISYICNTLTSSVSAVEQEILKTGVIVSDLFDVFYDATIHKKLNNFSVHVLIKKAEIKIFDMLLLNQNLMLSMLQTISTYIFIKIQFVLSSDRQ
uniref:Gustatory receptor n=1 Tax=Trichogramma kaykai TaxID=54128 RepID=A0ABD2X4D4_9HYME